MKSPRLNLVVIRSIDTDRAADFYRLLGLEFQRERHGKGPVHFAADLEGMVFEIYPAKSPEDVDSTTRLGFGVPSVRDAVNVLRSSGVEVAREAQESDWGVRAVVRDPDGRAVELFG